MNHALLGNAGQARALAEQVLREHCCGDPTTRADILGPLAGTLAILGDKPGAIALIGRLLDSHTFITSAYVRNDPMYATLHGDPAFAAMLAKADAAHAAENWVAAASR